MSKSWLRTPNEASQLPMGPLFDRKYPDAPGYKRDGTSKQAALDMASEASGLRSLCLSCLHEQPLTADEIASALVQSVLAIRPRISELVARGKIEDSGLRRKNVSGKSAIVWRITNAEPR